MQRYIRRFGEAPPFNSQGSLTADGNAVTDQDPVV